MRALMVLLAAALVTGCASTAPMNLGGANASASSPLASLQSFTVDDLTAALADATAHNDTVAMTCWATLLPIVKGGVPSAPSIKGIASAVQAKRDLLGAAGSSQVADLRKAITVGCAALFVEENRTLLKFGAGALPGGGIAGMLLQ